MSDISVARPLSLLAALGLLASVFAQTARADFVSQVLSDNPVGFWILNDSTTAADSSGNGFDGTYEAGVDQQSIAGPSWVPGSGQVADFDGTGNISFASTLDLGANDFTIMAWIRPALAALQDPGRIVATSSSGFDGYGFGTTEDGALVFTAFTVQDYITTTLQLLPNRWYYVGVVLDAANNATFYVDGAFVETVAGTLPTDPAVANFNIGSRSPPSTDEHFTGGLAGISVYDTALTGTQIQSQYFAATVPEPSSLVLSGLGALGAGYALQRRRRRMASSSIPR